MQKLSCRNYLMTTHKTLDYGLQLKNKLEFKHIFQINNVSWHFFANLTKYIIKFKWVINKLIKNNQNCNIKLNLLKLNF